MQWLKCIVKKYSCMIIALTWVTLMIARNFAMDVARQTINQQFDIMEKKNTTFADFNFDPNQFWVNPVNDSVPTFQPFRFDDDLDFDFDFQFNTTNGDIFEQINKISRQNN